MIYRLVGRIDGKPFNATLHPGANRLGRSSRDADHHVPKDTVSRVHAQIDVGETGLEIRDCNSHNHTYVNDKRIERAVLHPNDWIRLGDVELQLVVLDESKQTVGSATERTDPLPESHSDTGPTFRSDVQHDSMRLTWTRTPTGPGLVHAGADLMRALVELGSFLVRDEPGRDIAEICLEHVSRLVPFRLACLLEVQPSSGEVEVRAHHPASLEPELHVSRTMVDTVVRNRKTLLLREVPEDDLANTINQKGIRSAIVTPLMQDEEVLGVLYLDQSDPTRSFGSRQRELVELLANLVAAKIASTRTRREFVWAGEIQQRLLPEDMPHPEGYEVAARLVPFELVGGDLYEAMELPDGRYLYVLGDVVGHGMGAALMMSNALATLRALALAPESSLHLATRLHTLLRPQLPPECYVTMFLGILDPRTHELDYVTAGHPPPMLLGPNGQKEFLVSTALAIAMPIPHPIQSATRKLTPGNLLAIWSDGIPEAVRLGVRPMQDFTQERLIGQIEQLQRQPLEEILEQVFRASDDFIGGPKAQDDRALLLLRRRD